MVPPKKHFLSLKVHRNASPGMQILKLSHPSRRGYPSPAPSPMRLCHNKVPATLITPPGTFFQIENPAGGEAFAWTLCDRQ